MHMFVLRQITGIVLPIDLNTSDCKKLAAS